MVENLDRMLWHLDEPLADPAAINVLLIAESAKRSGVSVLLSGAGGMTCSRVIEGISPSRVSAIGHGSPSLFVLSPKEVAPFSPLGTR